MVYSDRLSKLSLSSRRCFAGLLLLLWPDLSLVDTELERDISLPSSVSTELFADGFMLAKYGGIIPGVASPLFTSLPKMRSRALLYAASLSSLDNLESISHCRKFQITGLHTSLSQKVPCLCRRYQSQMLPWMGLAQYHLHLLDA